MKLMEFRIWLENKINERETNPTALADAIKENQSTIQRILSGETKNPRLKIIRKLEDYFSEKSYQIDQLGTRPSDITINQYADVQGSMGVGILLRDQPGQITGFKVNSEWMNKNVPSNTGKDNLAIVTGFGDSMRGMFNSGDPLLIDTGIKSLDYDGVYFFRVGNEGFIKRLQRIPGDGIRAISTNKEYESWTITKDMDFEVFGRVLKVWNSEDF
jgi:phage repressor protein C with HTH and peptisase S24 domain